MAWYFYCYCYRDDGVSLLGQAIGPHTQLCRRIAFIFRKAQLFNRFGSSVIEKKVTIGIGCAIGKCSNALTANRGMDLVG